MSSQSNNETRRKFKGAAICLTLKDFLIRKKAIVRIEDIKESIVENNSLFKTRRLLIHSENFIIGVGYYFSDTEEFIKINFPHILEPNLEDIIEEKFDKYIKINIGDMDSIDSIKRIKYILEKLI